MSEREYSPPEQPWDDLYWYSQDGLRLHYRDYAGSEDRPPVVCLHGLTRNARDFGELAARLASEWRVIVPEFRGRGLSEHDPVPERYAPPTYAADILQLLDLLHVGRAIFIGTSLGGLVTMAIAAVAPQRIAGVLLNDIGPQLEPEGLERIRGFVGQAALFQDWEEAASFLRERNEAIHPNYDAAGWRRLANRLCIEDEDGIRFDYDMAISCNVLAAGGAPVVDGWPMFRALSGAPLLVVRGERSDLLSRDTAERMTVEHPAAELIEICGVGHAPDLDEPDTLAGIKRLLDKAVDAAACGNRR